MKRRYKLTKWVRGTYKVQDEHYYWTLWGAMRAPRPDTLTGWNRFDYSITDTRTGRITHL